ncbi:MAG: hypothetical protein V4704_09855 [Pseudomonadota bacterium]
MDARNQFMMRSALVFGATTLLLLGLLSWQMGRDAERAADRTVATLALTQEVVEALENRNLVMRGELVASNQAVVAYMTEALGSALPGAAVDRTSIFDLLEERRTQLDLDAAAVVGVDGEVLAATDPTVESHDFAKDPVFQEARKAQESKTGLWSEGGRLMHVAILPLARYGSGDAYLLVGQVIGEELVQTIAGIGAADVAIIAPSASGPVVAASTLDPSSSEELAQAVRDQDGRGDLSLSGLHAQPESAPLFGDARVRLLALVRDPSFSSIVATHLPTAMFGVVMWLALAAALAWYWLQVATPLLNLERLMLRSAETGDRNLSVPERGAPTIVRVAAAFNRLMGSRNGTRD